MSPQNETSEHPCFPLVVRVATDLREADSIGDEELSIVLAIAATFAAVGTATASDDIVRRVRATIADNSWTQRAKPIFGVAGYLRLSDWIFQRLDNQLGTEPPANWEVAKRRNFLWAAAMCSGMQLLRAADVDRLPPPIWAEG